MMAEAYEESKVDHTSKQAVLFGNRTGRMQLRVECRRCHDVLFPSPWKAARQLPVRASPNVAPCYSQRVVRHRTILSPRGSGGQQRAYMCMLCGELFIHSTRATQAHAEQRQALDHFACTMPIISVACSVEVRMTRQRCLYRTTQSDSSA